MNEECCESKRQTQIHEYFNKLDNSLCILKDAVTELQKRLQPICRQEPNANLVEKTKDPVELVSFAQELKRLEEYTNQINDKINYIFQTIEL